MTALAQLVEGIPLPALAIRRDERIVAANAAASALLGPGLVGRHFITALRQPELLERIEASLRDTQPREGQYLSNDGAQDTTYTVSLRSAEIEGAPGLLVCFTDTTPLEQAGQIRRDFVANVSHELRTPLTALLGFIETLKGPAARDPKAQARFLDIMELEAGRMNRLVDDLLSLSRVEAQVRVRPVGRVDLAGLMQEAVRRFDPLSQENGVVLAAQTGDEAAIVPGDEDQLRQVIGNLVENAIKYAGQGAAVTLTLGAPQYEPRLRAEGLRLTVSDTGPGLEPHHLPRLTERFYRVDGHRSREKGGTGLGLAIVKHIVNRHRGRFEIASTPGKGSRFAVVLPLS